MALRVVAIPLFAAICLASPAVSNGDQVKKGRGYSPREGGGGGQTATRSGGDNNNPGGETSRGGGDRTATTSSRPAERRADSPPEERRAVSRPPDERRVETRSEEGRANTRRDDRDDDRQRYAVRRNNSVIVNTPPRININIGSSYGRHYAPIHYDYWARRYYRWSPIRYAPWSLIYGSIGFPNYGFYGGIGPNPFYYGHNGYGSYGPGVYAPYGAYPAYSYPHEAGGVRLKVRPRDAQVFVDGYYAGRVDDFDGAFQALRLEAGGHKIEIRLPGFDALELDVHVQPGRTITLEEVLRPNP